MTHHTVSLTVTRDGEEIDVEVVASYVYSRAEPRTHDYPMGGAPESEDVEIESVSPEVDLTEAEIELVEEKVCEAESAA